MHERTEAYRLDRNGMIGGVSVYCQDREVYLEGYGDRIGLRCEEAVRLLSWLRQHEAFLRDQATNYYECRECGQVHHRSLLYCPFLGNE